MAGRLSRLTAVALVGLALTLGVPAAASGATPDVVTFPGNATGASTALVWGQVNPEGEATTWAVEWDLQSAHWCMSGGTSGSPTHTSTATSLGFTDANFHDVMLTLTGLSRSSTYCARIVATNADGKGVSSVQTWVQNSPEVQTTNAFPSSATSGTVEGKINPLGENSTTYWLSYATADSDWCNDGGIGNSGATSATYDLGFSDSTFHDVSITLDGLTTGTAYCARFVALSDGGYEPGAPLVTFTVNAPSAEIFDAISTGNSTATVRGAINAAGAATNYQVQYDLAGSTWCTSNGSSGSPAHTTDPTAFEFNDETLHNEFVDLDGLSVGQDYCAQLIATNANGVAASGQTTWTQGEVPGAVTLDAFSTGGTTATVEGLVDPVGETTSYQVQYDLASSTWCTSDGTSGSPNTTTATSAGLDSNGGLQYVAVNLSALTETQDYCAQLIATNPNGETDGGGAFWTQGTATAETFDADSTGATTATVDGDVNPAGKASSYQVWYDLANSEWCASDGVFGSPAGTTSAASVGFTDATFHDVSVNLTGLSPNTDYCGEIVATNADGTSEGGQLTWTQPPPPPTDTVKISMVGYGKVTSSPAGINCGSGDFTGLACTSGFPQGSQVTLTATPSTGYALTSWGNANCPSSVNTCTITVSANQTLLVLFRALPNVTLTVSTAGSGSGTVTSSPAGINCGVTCSAQFTTGSQVTLTATPDAGARFVSWAGGGCSGIGTCTTTLSDTTTITAMFTAKLTPPTVVCVVPKVKGKTLAAAKAAIRKHHCAVGKITKVASSTKNKGHVLSQSPKAGKHLRKGAKIALKVGK